jgi:hypothetical protein
LEVFQPSKKIHPIPFFGGRVFFCVGNSPFVPLKISWLLKQLQQPQAMEDLTSVQSIDPDEWDSVLNAFFGSEDDTFAVFWSEEDLSEFATTASNTANDHQSTSRESGGDEASRPD